MSLKHAVLRQLKTLRHPQPTVVQEHVSSLLRETLKELERERRDYANRPPRSSGAVHSSFTRVLQETSGSYTLHGAPFSSVYVDDTFSDLLLLCRESAVHECLASNVLFAVATHVEAYTSSAVSLWVFLVALVPRQ